MSAGEKEIKERIILAPGANGNELAKSLALHGTNSFNLRICGAGELARTALMRSGAPITKDLIDSREEIAFVAKAAEGEKYFTGEGHSDLKETLKDTEREIKPANASYSDLQEITRAIRLMRSFVSDGNKEEQIIKEALDLENGPFKEKNNALFSVYKKYKDITENKVDSVSLIRMAIEKGVPFDADFYALEEYPLNPLERALLAKLSGGQVRESKLAELFGIKDSSAIKINSFKNCYGAANETETILEDIYKNKKLDRCTVAVTDAGIYGQLFFDHAVLYDIPIAFECGVPVINSNPAKLLSVYHHWMTDGFFGAKALNAMLYDGSFDRSKLKDQGLYPSDNDDMGNFRKMLGDIRMTNDKATNKERLEKLEVSDDERKFIPCLEKWAIELSLPVDEFIRKYAYIRKGGDTNAQKLVMALDMAAAGAICDELKVIREAGISQTTEDIISHILKKRVTVGQSEGGKLLVTDIDGALSSVRKNLYLAGLSASKYPGSPKENYLLLDTDIEKFGKAAEYMKSDERVKHKRERLLALAQLASDTGAEINVSFAGLNVSELKKDNASSLVFELYKEMRGQEVTLRNLERKMEKTGYFEPAVSLTRKIGKAYIDHKDIVYHKSDEKTANVRVDIGKKAYSPSELEDFFDCQRRFMLKRVLEIPEPSDDSPFAVISGREGGNLMHAMMEELANSHISKEKFLERSLECFDSFISRHPPLLEQELKTEREQFRDMMAAAYDMDPRRVTVAKEEELKCTHESGIRLHGYPDRVEELGDGSYLVVDFKSKNRIEHKENDIDSCLQIVIYAYLTEKALTEKAKGLKVSQVKVSQGEFRYPRWNKTVECRYDEEMKEKLSRKLAEFKEGLEKGEFPVFRKDDHDTSSKKDKKDDRNPCKYCQFGAVCGKPSEDEEEMESDND